MHYGLESKQQLMGYIASVCIAFGEGYYFTARDMLRETACAETHFGEFPDRYEANGHSPYQIDEIRFHDTIIHLKEDDFDIALGKFGYNLMLVKFDDLKDDALLSTIIARLAYKRVPNRFPFRFEDRAAYWKDYWNTSDGKGTPEEYIQRCREYL